MDFLAPEWLILLPIWVLAAFKWPALKLLHPLRITVIVLLILALSEPRIKTQSAELTLWVLVDRSASMAGVAEARMNELESILESSKPAGDVLRYIDYADVAVWRGEGDESYFRSPRAATRLGLAIRYALGRMDSQSLNRLLTLTDGFSTEDLKTELELLKRRKAPLSYRLVPRPAGADFRIQNFSAPPRLKVLEPFMLELQIEGEKSGEVQYQVFRNDTIIKKGATRIEHGRSIIRFVDRLPEAGSYAYRAEIKAQDDALPANNTFSTWVEVSGSSGILLISQLANDPLAALLEQAGFEVTQAARPRALIAASLSGRQAVIINNVPAASLSREFLKAIDFYVTSQGGGFAMIGGRNSFGSGGYFGSPVDSILPVSMELREEERRVQVALAFVLDRSGSMAAGVSGGMGSMTKMDLANEGAAKSASLLGPKDLLAVLAVDSEAHMVVPPAASANNLSEIAGRIRSIRSEGGGIFVYTGLNAAWQAIKDLPPIKKHIVLFSDAADSEEPGEYHTLIDEIVSENGSVSVIGLGTESDSDAELLKDIALRAQGRCFFVSNAMDLPAVFAQETVSVARSAFVTEPISVVSTPLWREISAENMNWLSEVTAYNLGYIKPGASQSLHAGDDQKTPLVAFWRRGSGRAAAVAFPLSGEFSTAATSWKDYEHFARTLSRWLLRPDVPPGLLLRVKAIADTLLIELRADSSWYERLALSEPEIRISGEKPGDVARLAWEKVKPGVFQARTPLRSGVPLRGAVSIGDVTLPFGPVGSGQNAEWHFDRARLRELEQLSRQSGGEEVADLSRIWQSPRTPQIYALKNLLLTLALLVFITEIFFWRLNINLAWTLNFSLPRKLRIPAGKDLFGNARRKFPDKPPPPEVIQSPIDTDVDLTEERRDADEVNRLRQRFSRAKRRDV